MKQAPNYPIWLTVFVIIGPFLMVSGVGVYRNLIRILPTVGAVMVVFALFYLSKRLHEQIEAVESLKQLLNRRDQDDHAVSQLN